MAQQAVPGSGLWLVCSVPRFGADLPNSLIHFIHLTMIVRFVQSIGMAVN